MSSPLKCVAKSLKIHKNLLRGANHARSVAYALVKLTLNKIRKVLFFSKKKQNKKAKILKQCNIFKNKMFYKKGHIFENLY